MKTLNLNKLTILISLFLISVIFSSGAQANSCVKDANGVIETYDGPSDDQVKATSPERTGFTDACTDTPDEYKLTFYKLGLCTADTSFNDLSSCKFVINSAAGIEHTISGLLKPRWPYQNL